MGRPRHPAAGGSGAGDRPRPLHGRSSGDPLGALRPQPGRIRPHRSHQRARRRTDRARREPRRRAADPAHAAQVQLSAHRAARPRQGRGALRGRTDRRNRCGVERRGGRPGRARGRRDRRIARNRGRRRMRCGPTRRSSTTNIASNVVVEARSETPGFADAKAKAHRTVQVRVRSRRQNATPLEARAAHAAFDPASDRITLTCATQMPHLLRTAIADVLGHCRIRFACGCAGRGRRLRPENVAAQRICRTGLAGAKAAQLDRLVRRPARESDRRVPQPRPAHRPRRRLRRERKADRTVDGHPGQHRRLFVLSVDGGHGAADGGCRNAGPLRCPRLRVHRARRDHAHLLHGRLSRRFAPGHYARHRAADGQSGGRVRFESRSKSANAT